MVYRVHCAVGEPIAERLEPGGAVPWQQENGFGPPTATRDELEARETWRRASSLLRSQKTTIAFEGATECYVGIVHRDEI